MATPDLDNALKTAEITDLMTIILDVGASGAGTPYRTPQGEDAFALEMRAPGRGWGQVVLAVDEEGVATWNFPEQAGHALHRFSVRRHVPDPPGGTGEQRALVQLAGKKVLKVLAYRVRDFAVRRISAQFATVWEKKFRPYRVRHFGPGDYKLPDVPPLDAEGWRKLGARRSLLFLHGTFSTSSAAFGGLPDSTLKDLYDAYEGRVFAFDHPTLSKDPEQNAAWFLEQIPSGVQLEVDIVCHSRGGLLARTLAGELQGTPFPPIRVRRIVFVATPNHGTALADPAHMASMLDRYTSILNLAPRGLLSTVTEVLESIVTAVKVVGQGAVAGLPGIAAMNPQGDFIKRLATPGRRVETEYYAIAADFEPKGSLRELVKMAADQVLDRVFEGEANDLVVPTRGVYEGSAAAGFPLLDLRLVRFEAVRQVDHSGYFSQPETSEKLRQWLTAGL